MQRIECGNDTPWPATYSKIWRPGVNVRVNTIAPGIFPSEMTGEARLVDENPVPVR